MIPNYSMIPAFRLSQLFDDPQQFDDPQLFDDQLEVGTLIIHKSTVIPPSLMVLFAFVKDCHFTEEQACTRIM